MDTVTQPVSTFAVFLQLEQAARQAETVEALRYTMVNDLRRLVQYRQAALILDRGEGSAQVAAVSGVAVPEPDAPYIRWLTGLGQHLLTRDHAGTWRTLGAADVPGISGTEWPQWSAAEGLWCPLSDRDGTLMGGLWLARDQPWQPAETALLERLCGCYAHAWQALSGNRRRRRLPGRWRRRLTWVAAALALGALAIPVSQSALAPAEVVAQDPLVVAAPLDGVIARFHVSPNQPVEPGQPLFDFDDTTLTAQMAAAERSLGITQAELQQARQGAMIDRKQAAQVALLEAQLRLRQVDLDYARSLLARVTVKAERAGVAVFPDANDWIGRPVTTGQRILQLADPERTELRLSVAVRDAVVLAPGAPVTLFLDVAPLEPIHAAVIAAAYEAEMPPSGVLSYRVRAAFDPARPPPRLGLQGTARLSGEPVPLAVYLFRRPIASARQTLGF